VSFCTAWLSFPTTNYHTQPWEPKDWQTARVIIPIHKKGVRSELTTRVSLSVSSVEKCKGVYTVYDLPYTEKIILNQVWSQMFCILYLFRCHLYWAFTTGTKLCGLWVPWFLPFKSRVRQNFGATWRQHIRP